MSSIPIILRPGMEIAQILFSLLSSPIDRNYQETGRYKDGAENFTSYVHKEEI